MRKEEIKLLKESQVSKRLWRNRNEISKLLTRTSRPHSPMTECRTKGNQRMRNPLGTDWTEWRNKCVPKVSNLCSPSLVLS